VRPELRVLGPLELLGDGDVVALSGQKHRRLLAALALAGGRACPADALVEAVWGGSPPASAPKLLQVYVSQLRKALPAGLAVVTRPAGYALDLGGASLDAESFERLLEEAGGALEQGNPALAVSLAEQALALWRGPAYADVMYEEFAQGEAARLEDLRLIARETRLDAQLRLGRHEEALGEILALADEHPLREHEQELAMLALYRSGRQVDALERYASLRRRLDEELGLEPGARLRELQRQILQQDAALDRPEPGLAGSRPLPEAPNPLVGRERELAELCAALLRRDVRLLVLTGSGGSGKTRLALEAARRVAPSFANGSALVELAPLRDPELIVPAIARALGLGKMADEQSLDALASELRTREVLLVLDNAEHLRSGTATFVELLARAPRLTLLVTSRAVLHLSGEHVFPVAPLDEEAALELFAQRARALQPRFQVTGENQPDVREICARVDRLPLAIELAAARIRTLEPRTLLERLTERLTLLSGGPHDLPARQQTLRETLDWSFDLLEGEARLFLARLSVFPSGATLEAAAEVCLEGEVDGALELVERLLDASLLNAHEHSGGMRYTLLETVRQYAADRLRDVDGDDTPRRHAEWCLALAEAAETELGGDQQTRWFATLEAEHDNLRSALAYLGESGEHGLQLRLAVALSRFWYVRGHLGEGRRRLEDALVDVRDQPPELLRRALTAASAIALLQGDYQAATAFSEVALDAARRSDKPRNVANALSNLGAIVLAAGDHARATVVLEEAVPLARTVGDTRITALAINNLGDLALTTGDYERARPLFEESHALLEARGDTANLARSQFNRGAVDLMLGDLAGARLRFREGLLLASQTGDKEDVAWCLEGLASVAAREGEGERAATLLGVSGGLLRQMGADFKPFERQLHEATRSRAQELCGLEEYGELIARGESLPLAVTDELAVGPDSVP
jgi:predicted ATPase/DNA-binding SARP family transcriptional activator